MTATAPTVGSRAAVPGKGVEASNRKAAYAIIASPTQPRAARSTGPRSRHPRCTATASSDPSPSSQTRVGVTK